MVVRMLRVMTAGVIFLMAAGAQAQVQVPKDWYIAIGGGGAWYDDQKVTGAGGVKLSTDTGYTANVGIGTYVDEEKVVRLELEGVYENADYNNFGGAKVGGSTNSTGLMFNVLYDIQTGSNWVPYLGAGIGYARVNVDNVSQFGVTAINGNDNVFAWQFKGGIAYQFNPSMAVTVGYRYFGTDNLSFGDQPGGTVKTEGLSIQSAEVGFRYHF